MMIKLLCKECGFSYEVSEKELKDHKDDYHSICECGGKLEIAKESLKEIVRKDLAQEVKENVDTYFKNLGIEYTIEMIERCKDYAISRLYREEIRRRGFKIK